MAEALSVGRAEVNLPGESWQSFPVTEDITEFGGDRSGQIKSERRVFVRKSASGAVEAVVLVGGSSGNLGTAGKLVFSPNCKSDKYWYRQGNEGFNRPFAECWGALKGHPVTLSSIATGFPELVPTLSQEKWQMPLGAHVLFSTYRNENGTFLTVNMFVIPGFSVSNASAVELSAQDISPTLVQYGRQLSDAVRASVMSLSGKFVLPSFNVPD